jgi:hypothetical protein
VHTPACSLTPGRLEQRISEWHALSAQALEHHDVGEGLLRSTFPNRPDIAKRLRHLIAAENECCPFLEFHVREHDEVLEVELGYPPDFALGTRLSHSGGTPPENTAGQSRSR